MKRMVFLVAIGLLAACLSSAGHCDPAVSGTGQSEPHPAKVVFKQVKLTQANALQWESRSNQIICAQLISGPVAVQLRNCSDIVISACDLGGVQLIQCKRITIRNCWIHNSVKCGVDIDLSQQVRVQGCRFENVASGVYALDTQQIDIVGCFARNVQGPMPRGQFVQFDHITGAGNTIAGNYVINDRGKSHPEDDISLYKSSGETASPILIEDNYLTGDPTQGSIDKSKTGSGIMLGDNGGDYLTCRRNVIVSAGQCGIGVAGGNYILVENNVIYGMKSNVSNVGLYVWNQSGQPSDNVTVSGNHVEWTMSDGEENSWWDGGNVQHLMQTDNVLADPDIASHIPAPPSVAPLPPRPWVTPGIGNTPIADVPWPDASLTPEVNLRPTLVGR